MPYPFWRKLTWPEINTWPTFRGTWNYGQPPTRIGYPPWKINSEKQEQKSNALRPGFHYPQCHRRPQTH